MYVSVCVSVCVNVWKCIREGLANGKTGHLIALVLCFGVLSNRPMVFGAVYSRIVFCSNTTMALNMTWMDENLQVGR